MTAIEQRSNKINFKYILTSAIAVLFSWILHEFAHWLTGTLMGYQMVTAMNSTYPLLQHYDSNLDYQMVSAAGSLFTLVEAIIVFAIMRRKKVISLYPFLFTCFYMRLLATIVSFLNPNDEARISQSMGIGTFTLPIISVAIFFFLLYKISKKYGFNKKFNVLNCKFK